MNGLVSFGINRNNKLLIANTVCAKMHYWYNSDILLSTIKIIDIDKINYRCVSVIIILIQR